MGFFSKIFKSVGKVFKKIGKGIKSAFKKFGKFMGKIGILGQAAMFFVMPYIGAALGSAFMGGAGALATNTVGGALGAVGQAAGKVMQFVGNTVSKGFNVYSNITKGVTETLGNFAKTASNKMFGTSFDAASNFFGAGDSAFSRSFGENSRFANLTTDNVFFEDIKKSRQVELDRKTMNTLDEVVTESESDFRAYGQTEFIADPNIEQAISRGETNLVSSRSSMVTPDPQALAQQRENLLTPEFSKAPKYEFTVDPKDLPSLDYNTFEELPFDPYSQENLARAVLNDAGNMVGNADPDKVYQPSLLDRLKTGIKNAPSDIYKKAGKIADDPVGYVFNKTEESLQDQLNLRVGQELGISEKPEYNVQNISNVAFVPSMDSFSSSQSQYGAQEIMSPRAFEQQVTLNPNPYGYTAFQYGNYMSQLAQTA